MKYSRCATRSNRDFKRHHMPMRARRADAVGRNEPQSYSNPIVSEPWQIALLHAALEVIYAHNDARSGWQQSSHSREFIPIEWPEARIVREAGHR